MDNIGSEPEPRPSHIVRFFSACFRFDLHIAAVTSPGYRQSTRFCRPGMVCLLACLLANGSYASHFPFSDVAFCGPCKSSYKVKGWASKSHLIPNSASQPWVLLDRDPMLLLCFEALLSCKLSLGKFAMEQS